VAAEASKLARFARQVVNGAGAEDPA